MKFIPTALALSLTLALSACGSSGSSNSTSPSINPSNPSNPSNPNEKPDIIEEVAKTKNKLTINQSEITTTKNNIAKVEEAINSKKTKNILSRSVFLAMPDMPTKEEETNPYKNPKLTVEQLNEQLTALEQKLADLTRQNKDLEEELKNAEKNFNDTIEKLSKKGQLTQQVLTANEFNKKAEDTEVKLVKNIASAYAEYKKDNTNAMNNVKLFEAINALKDYQDEYRTAYQDADKYNRELGELEGDPLAKFGFNSLHRPMATTQTYKLDPKRAEFEGELGLLLAGDGINNSNASTKSNNQQSNLNHFFLTKKDFEQGKGIAFAKDGEEIGQLDSGAQVNVIENGDNLIRTTFFSYDNIQFGEFDQITENGKEVENSSRSYAIFNKTPTKVVNAQTGKAIFNGDGVGTLHNESIDLGYYPVTHKVKITADYDKKTMEGKIFDLNSPKDELAAFKKNNLVPKEFEFKANIDKNGLATNGSEDRDDIMIYHAGAKGEELAVGYDLHKDNWNIKGVAGAKKEQSATKK